MAIDNIKDPSFIINIDSAVRRYNNASNMLGIIPSVGVNDRFSYSPRTLQTPSANYGLLDKTMVMPFNMDPIPIYASLRNYQKFPIKVFYDYPEGANVEGATLSDDTGMSGSIADYSVIFRNVPPISTDKFMNGVRGIDADAAVWDAYSYASGNKDRAELWAPLWNNHTARYSNTWGQTHEGGENEFGIRCGPVHILETFSFYATATENNGKIEWTDPGYNNHLEDATIDKVFDWIYDTPPHRNSDIYITTPISACTTTYKVVPNTPNEDGILDFKVSFTADRVSDSSTIEVFADMPKKVAFTNLSPYPIEMVLFCHPYNWYFAGPNNSGRYLTHFRCRNNFGGSTIDLGTAEDWAACRSPQNTFYDFGTGLKAYTENGGNMKFNIFNFDPFETKTLIEINENDIFTSDSFTSENFHGWDGVGYKYNSNNVREVSDNPYNSGCYGFWIDLNECFFRLKRD